MTQQKRGKNSLNSRGKKVRQVIQVYGYNILGHQSCFIPTPDCIFNTSKVCIYQASRNILQSFHVFFRHSDADEPKQKLKKQKKAEERGKEQKKGATGLLAPLPLSDALVKFIGTGENALSRGDVIKRMWDYIKQNDLQVCHYFPFCNWHYYFFTTLNITSD